MRNILTLCMGLLSSSIISAQATATMMDANGKSVGTVIVREITSGLVISGQFKNLVGSEHALHIHSVGLCEGPKFATAKGHWNPVLRQHGLHNPKGAHKGDMPNLRLTKGQGALTGFVGGVTMADLLDSDGASFILHAGPDDNMTDPAGNSGDRIACGALAENP
jgi:superoxide dismutase, Cu-Zn family